MDNAVTAAAGNTCTAAAGSVVVRDQEWLVTNVERATDGWFVHVQGLSELVRDTEATFSTALDHIQEADHRNTHGLADDSPGYRKSRLWPEATLRKTAVPPIDPRLMVAHKGLADPLPYQVAAVRQALDTDNLHPRMLLADAVSLGKTIEIGMTVAELVRRGCGERILVRFEGVSLTTKQAAALMANPVLRVYDAPGHALACCFDPRKALCRKDTARAKPASTPDVTACDHRCANIARTDEHLGKIEDELTALRAERDAPATPEPLPHRIRSQITRREAIVQPHYDTETGGFS